MKKILQTFLFYFVFSAFVFGQEFKDLPKNPQEVVSFKAKLGFENSEDKIIFFKFFDNEQKLLLLGIKHIQVWDVLENKSLYSIRHEIPKIEKFDIAVELSPDSRKAIVFDTFSFRIIRKEKRVFASVLDLRTGKKINELDGIEKGIRFARWSENGKTLVTFSDVFGDKGEVEFCSWEGETLERRFCKTIFGNASSSYLSGDGTKLFISLNITTKDFFGYKSDDFISLYDAESGKFIENFRQSINNFAITTVSPNDKYLVADNLFNKVSIWELNDRNFPLKFTFGTNKKRSARFLGFSPDSKLFAVRNEKNLEVYDVETKEKLLEFDKSRSYGKVEFSPNNKILIADDCDKADVFDIETQKIFYQLKLVCKSETSFLQTTIRDSDRISFHPNGEFFLTYSDKTARIWEIQTGRLLQTVINPENKKTKRKNKNADDGLGNSAGWILRGKFLYVLAADKESVLIWKVRGE